MPTFYTPQTGPTGGFRIGEALAAGYRDRSDLDNASQLRRIREEEAARARAQEIDAAESRRIKGIGERIALRGQIIGAGETADDFFAALPMLKEYGLPTSDLPELRSTASETFRARPEAPSTAPAWMPKAQPAWMPSFETSLPAPEAPPRDLPQGSMVNPADLQAVQVAAQRGLPLKDQARMQAIDLKLAAQADELERRKSKDQYLRDYAEKNFELRRQGLDAATADRETRTYLAKLGYGLDVERFDLTKKESERSAALGPKFTADQSNSAIYGRRVEQSIGDIDRVTSSGYNPSGFVESAKVKALVTGTTGAELVASPEEKQLAQAYRNAINAILRRESGAAIAASEFANAQQQYFPSVNDDSVTLAQKRRNLNQALTGFQTAAGGAWDATPLVGGQGAKVTKPAASSISTVSSQAAYDALPPGSQYKAPDGRILTKKAR